MMGESKEKEDASEMGAIPPDTLFIAYIDS